MRVPKAKDILSVPDMFLTKEERKEKQRRLQEKKEAEKPLPSGVTPLMFQKASVRREQLIAQADTSFKKLIQWRDLPFPSFPHVERSHPLPEVAPTHHVCAVHDHTVSLSSGPYFTGMLPSLLPEGLHPSLLPEGLHPSPPPEASHPSFPEASHPSFPEASHPSPIEYAFEDVLQAFLVSAVTTLHQ